MFSKRNFYKAQYSIKINFGQRAVAAIAFSFLALAEAVLLEEAIEFVLPMRNIIHCLLISSSQRGKKISMYVSGGLRPQENNFL